MRITIDTKDDNIEEIKHLISMLQNFVERKNSNPITSSQNSSYIDMFNTDPKPQPQQPQSQENSLFSMFSTPSSNINSQIAPEPVKKVEPRIQIIEY